MRKNKVYENALSAGYLLAINEVVLKLQKQQAEFGDIASINDLLDLLTKDL